MSAGAAPPPPSWSLSWRCLAVPPHHLQMATFHTVIMIAAAQKHCARAQCCGWEVFSLQPYVTWLVNRHAHTWLVMCVQSWCYRCW